MNKIIGVLLILGLFISCSRKEGEVKPVERIPSISMNTDLVIGAADDSGNVDTILGEPVAVRTDKAGNIYIADRASLTVKVFDANGTYLRSMGGRGRGPTEFHDINFMERTPEGHFLFLDRGNLRYTTLTKEGEFVSSYTIQLSNQFYINSLEFIDDKILGLYPDASIPDYPEQVYSRNFFRFYSTDFETTFDSFAPASDVGINDMYAWCLIIPNSGSMVYLEDKRWLVFSPGIYTGKIYVYKIDRESKGVLHSILNVTEPHSVPYISYETEQQYEASKDFPGANKIYFSGGPYLGKLNSLDAGIFYLPEREQMVQFYAEWWEGNTTLEEGNLLDLSVQVFDLEGNILDQSYLHSMHYDRQPYHSLVNWMDENENFYLLDYSNGEPVVRRFTLDLPG